MKMTYQTIHTNYGLLAMAQAEATGAPINLNHMTAHIDKITHTLAGAAIAAALLPLGASSESLAVGK